MSVRCAVILVGLPLWAALAAGCGGRDAGSPGPSASPSLAATTPAGAASATVSGTAGGSTQVPTLAPATATSPAPSVTAKPSDTPLATATATATATSGSQDAPARAIGAGEWTYDYHLVSTTCADKPAQASLAVTQMLQEVTGSDGYISDGEQVRVYGFNGGASLGTITFRWPVLSYQVPLNEPGGIRTEVTHTYFDARSGSSKVVEVYARGTGTCELTYAG